MLTNLEVSAVALAVVAPGAGATASAWRAPRAAGGRGLLLPAAIVGVVGELVVLLRFSGPEGPVAPALYPWFHVVPMLVLALLVVRAERSPARARLAVALAVVPWAVLAVALLLEPWLGPAESLRAGLLCGPGFPLVGSVATARAAWQRVSDPGAGRRAEVGTTMG
jgi:hypothetical protein